MRVLVVCVPQAGHVNPLLPLVSSLVAGGDEVVVATGEDVRPAVEGAGAAFRPAGSGLGAWFGQLQQRVRGAPGDGLPPHRITHYFLPRLFAEIAVADMVDDVLEHGRRLEPHVVLYDTYAFAGPLAGALLGAPTVHHLVGPLLAEDVLQLAADALSPLWRSFGRDVPPLGGVYGDRTVAICPPSLDPRRPPAGELVHLRPADPPAVTGPVPARPLVYVTLGTLWGDVDVFRAILTGCAELDVDLLVTVGPNGDPEQLAPVPPNARVERFVPQAELLPRCSAVVHHAGAGTMFGALAHGLPQVALPQAADNFLNAEMLVAAGVARCLLPGAVAAASVRDALRDVLGDPRYRAAAEAVAAEIARMPTAPEVAADLRHRFA